MIDPLTLDGPIKKQNLMGNGEGIQEQNESSYSEKIKKQSNTLVSGKDYLRKRTLKKGCPKLIKMVYQWSQNRGISENQSKLSFNYYSKLHPPTIPKYLNNLHNNSTFATTTNFSLSTAAQEYSR